MGLEMGKPGHSVHSREGGLVRGKGGQMYGDRRRFDFEG